MQGAGSVAPERRRGGGAVGGGGKGSPSNPSPIPLISSTHTTDDEQLNHAINAALILREGVPPQFSHSRVEHGVLQLEEGHQFALFLTLESVADPATAPWRLLDLQFLLPRVRCGVVCVDVPCRWIVIYRFCPWL